MENGDLRTFLRRCRPSLKAPKATINQLTIAQMAARLSSAMSFLERHRIIHRDVAARNVLVGSTVRRCSSDWQWWSSLRHVSMCVCSGVDCSCVCVCVCVCVRACVWWWWRWRGGPGVVCRAIPAHT